MTIKRLPYVDLAPADRASGVLCDQRIMFNGFYPAKNFPEHLRRIRFKDPSRATRS